MLFGHWLSTKDGDPAAFQLYSRHYSFHHFKDNRRTVGRNRKLMVGPGEKMVLVTMDYKALFIWRKFIDHSGQSGVNCAVFRNESEILSSDLIQEACVLAWNRWPGERLYTYVNSTMINSPNPGYCFKMAGWRALKQKTQARCLTILEIYPKEITA